MCRYKNEQVYRFYLIGEEICKVLEPVQRKIQKQTHSLTIIMEINIQIEEKLFFFVWSRVVELLRVEKCYSSLYWTVSLLLNMLSRLVLTFLPRSKRLLISWLQSPSALTLEPRKINSDISKLFFFPSLPSCQNISLVQLFIHLQIVFRI